MKEGSIRLNEWVDVDEMFPDMPHFGEPIEEEGEDGLIRIFTREKDGSVTYTIKTAEEPT